MTDTYIYQKVRKRFLSISGIYELADENGEVQTKHIIAGERGSDGMITECTNLVEPNIKVSRDELNSKDSIWFEMFILPSSPVQQELGTAGRNRWTFGLQININCPADKGTDAVDTVYNAIAAQFRRGDIFDGIRILQTAYRSSARMYDDFYSVPVTIIAQADLDN